MLRNNIILLAVLLCMASAKDKSLYILHTNNTNGALENCYCPDHPYGAIEKRAAFVESWLQDNPNTVIVDAGDLISLTEREYKDSLASVAYATIPYDAILPGDQELVRGEDKLEAILKRTGSPIVATNIIKPVIDGSHKVIMVKRSGMKIAIIGVIGQQAIKYYSDQVRESIRLDDEVGSIKKQIKDLEGKVDIIIVLTHQGYDYDLKLAANVTGIDVIIGAHSQTSLKTAQEINDVLVAQAGKEGYYVGIIELKLGDKGIISKAGYLNPMTLDMPDHPVVMDLIKQYERKTGIINRRKEEIK